MLVFQDLEIYQIADDMTDDEFFEFCVANRDVRIERDPDKKLLLWLRLVQNQVFMKERFFQN
jgi:hypothetical protein